MNDGFLTDHFLIAMPSLVDPNFARTVIHVCQHGDEGAMGLVINRSAAFDLGHVLRELDLPVPGVPIDHTPILVGGPVHAERGFVLHENDGRDWESSLAVNDQLSVTTSRDILMAFSAGNPPPRHLFALGYAGWTAGQLEQELADNAWLTVPADRAVLFDVPIEQRWQAAAGLLGVNPIHLSGYAGRA